MSDYLPDVVADECQYQYEDDDSPPWHVDKPAVADEVFGWATIAAIIRRHIYAIKPGPKTSVSTGGRLSSTAVKVSFLIFQLDTGTERSFLVVQSE